MIDLEMIRAGLDRNEFFLEYLPIVSLEPERCVGAEALLRWQRSTGVVFPDDFVRLVENTPLSGLLTYWVIDRVAAEMGDWLRKHDGVEMHINVPPEILGRGGLEYAAQKSGLYDVRHKLVLEITERGVPDQLGLHAIDLAARQGVRVALDDVRIDPASVMVLSRCNAQIIKIDKSVLLDNGVEGAMPRWAEALSVLLKTTDLEVIAEGVETAEQLAMLKTAGSTASPGPLFFTSLAGGCIPRLLQESRLSTVSRGQH
jgi:sensor c-di-GMP phosphodiesterase-like protein